MSLQIDSRTELVRKLAPQNLMQPATALWRVYEMEAVQRHTDLRGRILDLGCGDGSLARVIFGEATPGVTLVGLEPDAADAADARASGVYAQVHQVLGDAIPEPEGAFDGVFSNSVLEHIPSIEPVLKEVSRVLKRGGRFLFTVPSEQFPRCLQGSAGLRWLCARRGESILQAVDRRLQHHRYWSPDEWSASLEDVGLSLTKTVRYFPERAVRAWEQLSNYTGGIVFELMWRRQETRAAQRTLRLDRVDGLLPAGARAVALKTLLRPWLNEPADVSGSLSGGLLLEAVKR